VRREDEPGDGTDARLLRLGADDNVLIAARPLRVGESFVLGGITCRVDRELGAGFKVAAHDLRPGDVVLRLGMPIGEITAPVARGGLVHVHNLRSRYMRTHERGET
jgi:(2R)-sulfolactate sulfo-lyase subunit alpha